MVYCLGERGYAHSPQAPFKIARVPKMRMILPVTIRKVGAVTRSKKRVPIQVPAIARITEPKMKLGVSYGSTGSTATIAMLL